MATLFVPRVAVRVSEQKRRLGDVSLTYVRKRKTRPVEDDVTLVPRAKRRLLMSSDREELKEDEGVRNRLFPVNRSEVLEVYPYPITITTFQLAVGTVLILFMWGAKLYRRPVVSYSKLVAILPLAIIHTFGNLFTNMSLGKVSVSFTHTIKALEPFFTIVLSALFLGEVPTVWVLASLVPIVGGVASFNWIGFWSAMASNLANQSRNVLSKKVMGKKEESLDSINLFSIITIMSLFLTIPVMLLAEGIKFTPSYMHSAGLNLREIFTRSLLAGLCFHAYQQIARPRPVPPYFRA